MAKNIDPNLRKIGEYLFHIHSS